MARAAEIVNGEARLTIGNDSYEAVKVFPFLGIDDKRSARINVIRVARVVAYGLQEHEDYATLADFCTAYGLVY